jgi:hypothetical protein
MRFFKIAMIISIGLFSMPAIVAESEGKLSIASRAIAHEISGALMNLAYRINSFAADRVDHSILESEDLARSIDWGVQDEPIGSRISSWLMNPANRPILTSSILGGFLVLAATRPELFARFKNYLISTKKASGEGLKQGDDAPIIIRRQVIKKQVNIYTTSPGRTKRTMRTIYPLPRNKRSQHPAAPDEAVAAH